MLFIFVCLPEKNSTKSILCLTTNAGSIVKTIIIEKDNLDIKSKNLLRNNII